ncbi:hypothetical protein I316_02792 [Kwoniella heveanensis BCC8398]|uniref:Uncharacterized protein n=1 Tax=Kwoniella heveanensis BCC8398 TaxID=1296120 RepID=A0A1B9GW43_9TREE|nr:hypothetical protein I316_02792 [Kwoniella heveanensis BCC8398]
MTFMHVYGRVLLNIDDIASGYHEINGMDEDFFVFEKSTEWDDQDIDELEALLYEFCEDYRLYEEYEDDYARDIL